MDNRKQMITLQKYIEQLQEIASTHEQTLYMISSVDEYGDDFRETVHLPSVGIYENERFSEVKLSDKQPNVVCLN